MFDISQTKGPAPPRRVLGTCGKALDDDDDE